MRFDDRVAIVTGAARGIGRSYALLLASRGARVVVADHGGGPTGDGSSPEPAMEVVREIAEAGGEAVGCGASVSDESSAAQIIDTAIEAFGRLDIVVNNAGIHDPHVFPDLTIAQFQRMLEVHYLGTLFVIRSAWPYFIRDRYGRVVNTVSEAMLGGVPELTSYGAAKGAVFGLTRNLATEGHPHGIRVNAIAPRAYTRLSAEHTEKMAAERSVPKEMMAKFSASMTPDLVAPAAAFLAHESCPLNGEILQAGLGGVARIAVLCSQGISKRVLTVEDIADNLDAIMDMTGAEIRSAAEQSA
ncbi:SDR family NAD(P)-dependent oxidoreductase [Mycolicibacterium sp. P1-5]|uniref:SDR family NAD(P)-dependent oxidoreductase n=1 Tax=Mycolicibacterium sp. P1-5 TaxID=2024617 RepID=UPI001D1439F4|nr:SDR family NAD(P)-dependent oxidoreductase [Mycolicibacterium sp. P1-5]